MKVVAIYNLKGGVGKTTSAVNLGWSAARAGQRTLLWDCDPQAASTFYLRVKPRVKGGGRGLFRKRSDLASHIKGSDFEGLDLLPGDHRYRDNDLLLAKDPQPGKRVRKLLKPLRRDYDLLLIDCPPSIGRSMEGFLGAADLILVPVVPTTLAVRTLERTMAFCSELGLDETPLVPFLTMVDARKNLHRQIRDDLRKRRPTPLVTQVPASTDVEKMGLQREPIGEFAPQSVGGRAYASLWTELAALLGGASRREAAALVAEAGRPRRGA